ncbi:MAG: HD domain-containing protein [Oscillospiraceae bacterium]|nr:HD domain-containing protein [Oscillospiraceae bacterium]
MDWLEILKSEMLEITKTAAYEYFPAIGAYTEPYYNHKFEHVKQVETEALKLFEVYGGDKDIVLASVWIHDRYKPQFDGPDHGNKAADWVLENLESKGFPKEKVKAVEYAVRNHTGFDKRPLETLEAQILWDADKLAHHGPKYIFQTFMLFTSEILCKNYLDLKIKFEPTIVLENIMPALLNLKHEIDYDGPNYFHLDESWKIVIEKDEAVNAFLEALEKKL